MWAGGPVSRQCCFHSDDTRGAHHLGPMSGGSAGAVGHNGDGGGGGGHDGTDQELTMIEELAPPSDADSDWPNV